MQALFPTIHSNPYPPITPTIFPFNSQTITHPRSPLPARSHPFHNLYRILYSHRFFNHRHFRFIHTLSPAFPHSLFHISFLHRVFLHIPLLRCTPKYRHTISRKLQLQRKLPVITLHMNSRFRPCVHHTLSAKLFTVTVENFLIFPRKGTPTR